MSLQWGRDLSVAEGPTVAAAAVQVEQASMGPRPFGRGRRPCTRRGGRPQRCFNGAATFRSRKECRPHTRPKCRRRFNGAATFRSRKAAPPADESRPGTFCFNGAATFRSRKDVRGRRPHRPHPSFNGAATFRSRKVPARPTFQRPGLRASMGPRPFGRGRYIMTDDELKDVAGFNGAATFRSRKGLDGSEAIQDIPVLQWGRDLSVAEG